MKPRETWTREDYDYFKSLQIRLSEYIKPYHDRLNYLYSIAPAPGFYIKPGGRIEQLPLKKEWQDLIDQLNQELNDFITRYWDNV